MSTLECFINRRSLLLGLLSVGLTAEAAEIDPRLLPPPAKVNVDFGRDIRPIFENSCWRCHGPERPKSHFRLDNRDSALKGGDNGVDILPGNSAKSPLIHYVARLVPDMEMPPEGKGEPLTPQQVGLLRAWIDQGVSWQTTNPPVQIDFSAAPTLRWIGVEGDKQKFREIEGIREGFTSGLEHFDLHEKVAPDKSISVEGHALFPDDDVQVKLSLQKTDVGFIRGGFEQWRRYYDDTGGYYRPFAQPSLDLNRDLHLDLGRIWVDLGVTPPHGPQIVVGYEYQYKDGTKSTLEWGSVNGKNIYPATEDIHEHTHIFKFDLTHEFADWRLEESARVEIYDAHTLHDDVISYTLGPTPDALVHTSEASTHVQGLNTLHLERQLTDWWFLAGGYFYSRFEGDFSLNQTTTDALGVPVVGTFWSTEPIELSRETHIFDLVNQWRPLAGLNLSLGLQGQWERQEALGNLNLDQGDPNLPQLFLLQPATARSDLDTARAMEDLAVRYTTIPYTVLFADARFQQERIGQFEEEDGNLPEAFLRDTDAANDRLDVREGFNVSPWRWVGLNAEYRSQRSNTDYDHLRRFVIEGDGYSAFITHRRIASDGPQAKLSLHPARWVRLALTYQHAATDYETATAPVPGGITPGGAILAGNYHANVYGLTATLAPRPRLQLSGAVTYGDSRLATAQNGDPSLVPYQGHVYTFIGSATYALNPSTDLRAEYAFSMADYGESNVADGLPLGLNYTRHGVMMGINRRLTERLTTSLRYRFYSYSEPTSGGFNDYRAHGVFATVVYKWH